MIVLLFYWEILRSMVFLVGKESPFFDREEACRGFEKNKENLDDVNGFERLIKDSRFFNVYDKDGYIGSVFVYQSEADDFFYLGGYAKRKKHRECVDAVRQAADMFPVVYADTRHLNAVICLKKAGFEWVDRKKKLLRRFKK